MKIRLEHWEDSDYIITINDKLFGSTVTKNNGEMIKEWLEIGLKEYLNEFNK